jgi:multidrug efflux pump subunit AcrA (membrane-fusion protein)
VSVHDPFGLENTAVPESEEAPNTADSPLDSVLPDPQQPEFSLPLLIGAYVTAEIEGPYLENVFVIPRKAFREDDRVWLLTDEKKLAIKTAELVWKRRDDMLVRGLKKGDQIITSRIAAPVEGMDLRTADD